MGFSITWCAVREQNADQFVQKLGFASTGKTEEIRLINEDQHPATRRHTRNGSVHTKHGGRTVAS